jgi:hypothetical protein
LIKDVNAQKYEWVLNATRPVMAPGSTLSLSIFLTGGMWNYRLTEVGSNVSFTGEYTDETATSLKAGDQEVFALESYTFDGDILTHMGNTTLSSLLLDGRTVTGGWYYLGGWDPTHQPLFVVGGLEPPSSIAVQSFGNGSFAWSYSAGWRSVDIIPGTLIESIAGASAGVVILVLAIAFMRRTRSRSAEPDDRVADG